jgi:hypothetical protein
MDQVGAVPSPVAQPAAVMTQVFRTSIGIGLVARFSIEVFVFFVTARFLDWFQSWA